jgi:hypothetical protein
MNYTASPFFSYIIDFNVNDSPLSTDIRQNEKLEKNVWTLETVKTCKTEISPKQIFIRFELMPTNCKK